MKILIAGSGETGTHLAKMLSYEHQDVVLLSPDKEYLAGLDSTYNIMVCVGEATCVADLERARAGTADLFVAVTPSETDNLLACQLARHLGAAGCVARIEQEGLLRPDIAAMLRRAGTDTLVYPEVLVAREILSFSERNWLERWEEIHGGELVLAGARIGEGCKACGSPIHSLLPGDDRRIHVAAIRRARRLIIPRGDDIFQPGDLVYFMLRPADAPRLAELTGRRAAPVRDIMVTGAGAITRLLIGMAPDHYHFTVVEPDAARCQALAEEFPQVTVVNAGSSDIAALREEQLADMDLFLALSERPEANIVACMVAREAGVPRVVAQIEELSFMPEAEHLGIDKMVNKKLLTSATILRHILSSGVRVGRLVALEDAEVAEIEALPGSDVTGAPVKALKIPRQVTFGGLIRDGRGQLISGSTEIHAGDRVVVFFLPGSMHKVEALFR